jgi:hypothetical protein
VDLLQHLPNGGAVVAVITVVVLFLRQHETQQKRYDDRMDVIMGKFLTELSDSRREYIARLDRIEGRARPAAGEKRGAT